ncbi:hypothetical protein LSTR_LSTR008524 [Laodelphax striatellus]|uniref:Uncharacterized protein n=1 Tax=Laodelphax striatellus TaxID=195883 RepID=A0A482WRW9_LAOST|nr:hypothetical protein LSTR_LSTR008524 [Laodelphax striatellus]
MPWARRPLCFRGIGSHHHQEPPSHAHARPVKHLFSNFFCCTRNAKALRHVADEEADVSEEGESVPMGPLTLEEYIKTLEPYNPAIHGWRGDEPWKGARRRHTVFQCTDFGPRPRTHLNNGQLYVNQGISVSADHALYI